MYERIQGNDMYDGATNPPFGYALGASNVLFQIPTLPGPEVRLPSQSCRQESLELTRNILRRRVSQFSLGVQQAVGSKAVVSVSYVGALDRHLSYWQELNLPAQSQLACLTDKTLCTGTQPAFNGQVSSKAITPSSRPITEATPTTISPEPGGSAGQVTRDLNLQIAYTLSGPSIPAPEPVATAGT